MEHPDDLLPELALGTLDPPERAEAEAHVAGCPRCRAELASHARALSALAATLPPAAPSAQAERQVLGLMEGPRRFEHLTRAAGEFLDLDDTAVRRIFASVFEPRGWEPGPAPGITIRPIVAGPKLAGAATNLFRLVAGVQFPMHGHDGDEFVLILQGGYVDDQNGRRYIRGEIDEEPMARQHSLTVMAEVECFALVIHRPPGRAA